MAGETVRLLWRFGRRYAATVRVAMLPPVVVIAVLRAAPEHLVAISVTAGVAAVWTCAYGWWLIRSGGNGPVAVDVVVLLGVCASIPWTDAVAEHNIGWIRLLVIFACATYQWHTSALVGGLAALAVDGGLLAAVLAGGAEAGLLITPAWVLVAAALSRAAWVLVGRAAARADRLAAAAERARRESSVAEAVRAEEREFANALHDTAAATLLMVGTGQVRADAGWLASQARRDLERLRTAGGPASGEADLVELLRAELDTTHLAVELDAPARLTLPSGVAGPIADSVREALNNVRRHAGTDRATIRLGGDQRAVRVEVVDEGKGFSVEEIPATRRGLRDSVRDRMHRAGGAATITSAAGVGTVVRLEWRADHG
ncbi:sensor histidine kinase [Amycolatopsis aidingensis]|uniref:sensor histidine kinase n=1 Tax=Amycolatopsis aidingensis TaxID=2842453 RepID=UPI001C0E0BA9|nr:ATP-binding protein [Amycolatopsis aidingensis]